MQNRFNDTVIELMNGKHDDVLNKQEKQKLIKELIKDSNEMRKWYGHNRQQVFYDKVA